MKQIRKVMALSLATAVLAVPAAFAQNHHDDHHDNHHYVRHQEWKKGYHLRHEDWDRGEHIDWRAHHLRQPPRGYEWREVDGNFVLAAVATGVISTVIAESMAH